MDYKPETRAWIITMIYYDVDYHGLEARDQSMDNSNNILRCILSVLYAAAAFRSGIPDMSVHCPPVDEFKQAVVCVPS